MRSFVVLSAALVIAGSGFVSRPAAARGEFQVTIPEAGQTQAAAPHRIVIGQVTDGREFQDRPATADIPSLAEAGADAPAEVKATAVARVRDGYGKARSNVFVSGQTVPGIVRQALAAALTAQGHTVLEEGSAPAGDAVVLEVTIEKFWGWIDINPGGGFTGSGEMNMKVDILTRIRAGDRTVTVEGHGTNRLGVGVTARNWQKTFTLALQDYLARVQAAGL